MSPQFGQNSLTVSIPGMSVLPHGNTCVDRQNTRGHEPKCPASYLSTMHPSPAFVRMKRWWQRP
jgi:hypothetical protein